MTTCNKHTPEYIQLHIICIQVPSYRSKISVQTYWSAATSSSSSCISSSAVAGLPSANFPSVLNCWNFAQRLNDEDPREWETLMPPELQQESPSGANGVVEARRCSNGRGLACLLVVVVEKKVRGVTSVSTTMADAVAMAPHTLEKISCQVLPAEPASCFEGLKIYSTQLHTTQEIQSLNSWKKQTDSLCQFVSIK